MKYSTRDVVVRDLLASMAAVLMLVVFTVPLDAAEESQSDTPQASVSRTEVRTQTSGSSSASAGSSNRGAQVTRSGGSTAKGTANRSSRSSSSPSRRHHYGGGYSRGSWGAFFGVYPWGYYHNYYPYPYYPVFPTLYYGPYSHEYGDVRLGAVDLNVKPKKAEVWVDGQLIGRSGKFDGFPGYLWLERGRHELVFYHPGFATDVREVRILQGTVVKLNLRLQPGESIAPEKMARKGQDIGSQSDERRARSSENRQSVEPGRLHLAVEPADASVYLDGRFLGTGKELSALHSGLLVQEGTHTLEVVRPGYRAERLELTVNADEEAKIAVILERG
ncbi:MAG: PEGA domain-containing protein [Acidobacteriota bacterium]|nr:PEGA domain-containing protein [Acidobacteriota bacterium]